MSSQLLRSSPHPSQRGSQLLRSELPPLRRSSQLLRSSPHPSQRAASCPCNHPACAVGPRETATSRIAQLAFGRTPDASPEEASRVRDPASTAVTSRRTEHAQRVRTVGRFVLNERRGSVSSFFVQHPPRGFDRRRLIKITSAYGPGESPLRAACDGAISRTDEPSCVPTARHRAT
jgi:hypothetical protein